VVDPTRLDFVRGLWILHGASVTVDRYNWHSTNLQFEEHPDVLLVDPYLAIMFHVLLSEDITQDGGNRPSIRGVNRIWAQSDDLVVIDFTAIWGELFHVGQVRHETRHYVCCYVNVVDRRTSTDILHPASQVGRRVSLCYNRSVLVVQMVGE